MKKSKNKSVANYSVIFGLAFVFLFFSACGKKDNTDEIKLPLETKQVKKVLETQPASDESVKVNKILESETGDVVITAELISENKFTPKNILAEIKVKKYNDKLAALTIATSTNYDDGRIIFPAIIKGLTNLHIFVKADNIAATFSDFFDTCDGEDKTIEIKINDGVVLQGNVKHDDGIPVKTFYLRATPRGLYEKPVNPAHINKYITTDKDGDFKITGLLSGHYKFYLRTGDSPSITTNVYLGDEVNFINFVFPKLGLKYQDLNGIVLYELSEAPAEGIKVIFTDQMGKKYKDTTDITGKFKITVLKKYLHGHLVIDEPEFAVVKRRLEYRYNGHMMKLLLRETGSVTGKVITENGSPVQGVKVKITPTYHRQTSKANFNYSQSQWEVRAAYSADATTSTDENGDYTILKAAAPETYQAEISSDAYFLPNGKNPALKVMPGKTTECEITVTMKPVVMLKVIDEKGEIILSYSFNSKTKTPNSSYGFGSSIDLKEGEEWGRLELGMQEKTAVLSVKVETDDGKMAETNGIMIVSGKTNFVVLTLAETLPIIAAGFVYDHDMQPLVDKSIWARQEKDTSHGSSDHLGYFEITGMNIKKGTEVKLNTSHANIQLETNVLAGVDNIEWVLREPKIIKGRVCIETSDNPATNFNIGLYNDYNKKNFISENGKFSLPANKNSNMKWQKGKLYAYIEGYAPATVEFDFDGSGICDVGDIIVNEKTGTIKGRVIDDSGNPMSVDVGLLKKKGNSYHHILNARSDKSDGTFVFEDLPLETLTVTAFSKINTAASKPIKLNSGEILTIPDLIIVSSNSTLVDFNFLLPDGAPAANAHINYFGENSDKNGYLEKRIRFGNYNSWEIMLNGRTYYSDEFTINKNTTQLTVQLNSSSKITGRATINGVPINNTKISFQLGRKWFRVTVFNGNFEFEGSQGKYVVACQKHKCVAEVKLTESGPNEINFKSGSGTFKFQFPFPGKWLTDISLKINGMHSTMARTRTGNNDNQAKVTELPAGEYRIYVYCRDSNFTTNFSTTATLKTGETKKITF